MRVSSFSLVSFRRLSVFDVGPTSVQLRSSWRALYYIVFSPVYCQLQFSSLEVKYDKLRNGDEETWQKPLVILTTKDRCSEHLMYVTDVMQPEEISWWKSINIHTHIHTHTHTGQISVRGILVEHSHDIFLVYSEKVPYEIPANIPK